MFVYDCKDEDLGLPPLTILLFSGDTTAFFVSTPLWLEFVLIGDNEGDLDLDEVEARCALALVLMLSNEACLEGLAEDTGDGDGEGEADSFVIDGFFFNLLFAFLRPKYIVLSLSNFSFSNTCKSSSESSKVLIFFSIYFQQSIQLDNSVIIHLSFGMILLI